MRQPPLAGDPGGVCGTVTEQDACRWSCLGEVCGRLINARRRRVLQVRVRHREVGAGFTLMAPLCVKGVVSRPCECVPVLSAVKQRGA
jgi:hypothetical protein